MTPVTIACVPTNVEIFVIIAILLIPTIIIETILLKIFFKKSWGKTFILCAVANITSALTGIAFAFLVLILISIEESFSKITLIASWFILPAILIWIENVVYKIFWEDISEKKLLKAVIIINIITYIVFSVLFFSILDNGNPREKARRISCFSNLKSIGLSLKQYAMDYNDFFPNEGWEQLRINDYLTDYGVYNCPSTVTPKGKDNEKLTYEMVDYIYKKGLKDSEDSDASKNPLAWDKPENHEDYGNVLFVDGHVKGFKGTDWMEQAGIKKVTK